VREEAHVPHYHKHIRRNLLILSLANWVVAVIAWTISAYLGIASPASIFVYAVLFVVGIFAVIVAVISFLLEKFAHEPGYADTSATQPADAAEPVVGTGA
jgi:cation transporter-like permease